MCNKKILICGFGNIGGHVYNEMKDLFNNPILCEDYDRPYIYDPNPKTNNEYYIDYDSYVSTYFNIAFICVPTDSCDDGSVDTTIVENCVKEINADVIIIKSAIPPGTCDNLIKKYNKNIIVSPEFYGFTKHALTDSNFLILGGKNSDCSKVADFYHIFCSPNLKIYFTGSKTAEMVKYMENCYLALKVTFCSEIYNACNALGIDYNEVRELMVLDPRFGNSHSFINPEKPYYDSHCLNKDIPGFIKFCKSVDYNPILMSTVNAINKIEKEKNK